MQQLLKFVCLFICFSANTHLYGQKHGRDRIDSLQRKLANAGDDTNKCNLLKELSFGYAYISADTGIIYGRQGLALATRLKWKTGIGIADNNLGINYKTIAAYDTALGYYNEGLKIGEALHNKKLIGIILCNIGVVYQLKSDYKSAFRYYFRALKLSEETGDKNGMADDCVNIGNIYTNEDNYSKGLEYYFKALQLKDETGNEASQGATLENIGIVYCRMKDYTKAMEYYARALKIYEKTGNKHDKAFTLAAIATVYDEQKNYTTSLEYLFSALKLHETTGSKLGQAVVLDNIGSVYVDQKNYLLAIEYERRGLKLTRELGEKRSIAACLSYLGAAFVGLAGDTTKAGSLAAMNEVPTGKAEPDEAIPPQKKERLRIAIAYLRESLDTAMVINSLELEQSCFEQLEEAYKLMGVFEKATAYADSLRSIKDAVFTAENTRKIAGMEIARKEYQDSLRDAVHLREEQVTEQRQRNYLWIGGGVMVLLLGFTFFLIRTNSLLTRERTKSDALLLNILPEEVANQLKENGSAAAKQFDDVTVLFTDFVNFTEAGQRMKPQRLVEELHACFKAFDEITTKYNIEKIKTIGDAYLAVCGLPLADPKHAENVVKAAKEITAFMQDRQAKLGNSTFDIRIGIHSGSVVAGIVGVKKFAYDIWGDTVNTAARMEQNSEAGKINISATTYELVKDQIGCEYRGEIEVKGKGVMKMYFVNG